MMKRLYWLFTWTQLVAVCAAMVWTVHRYGCATTPDSAAYLSMARSFAESGQLNWPDGSPCSMWPPLYSIVIGSLAIFGPVTPAGIPIAAGCVGFAVILLAAARAALALFETWFARFAAVAAVAWSTTLLLCMCGLLSEVVFIPATTLFIFMACAPNLTLPRRMAWLFGCASVAMLARYVGVYLYFYAALFFLVSFARQGDRSWRLFFRVVLIGALSCIPVAAMFARNVIVTGDLTGPPTPSQFTLTEQVVAGTDILTQFLFPQRIPVAARIAAGLAMLAAALAMAMKNLRRPGATAVLTYFAWSAVYLVLVIPISQTRHTDLLDFRMLAPLYVPAWFTVIWLVERMSCSAGPLRLPLRAAGTLALAGLLALSLQRMAMRVPGVARDGWGMYTSREYAEHDLIRWIQANKPEGTLLSNAADAIYLQTMRPVHQLPAQGSDDLRAFPGKVAKLAQPCRVVWFENFWRPYPATPAILAETGVSLVPEATFAGGTVYRIEAPQR
jgi:hypothetical protein